MAKLDDTSGFWYALDPYTKKPYGRPLETFKAAALSRDALKENIDILYKSFGREPRLDICYATALHIAQADKKITHTVFNSLINQTKNGASADFYRKMNINTDTLKDTFRLTDVNESGLLSFVSKNGYNKDKVTHMAYLHKASDNQTYLYHSNSHQLDRFLGGIENLPATAGKANVYALDAQRQRGLQQFMDDGLGSMVAFTPASTLNSQVMATTV